MNKLKLAGYIGLLGLIVLAAVYGEKTSIPSEARVKLALEQALMDSPDLKQKYSEIKDKVIIYPDSLPGEDLGITKVSSDGTFQIVIDTLRVTRKNDRLEPVIAHEIFHAWEANKDIPSFLFQVEQDKKLSWENRTVEKSAISYENSFRQYVLEHSNNYKGMPKTRELQNLRSTHR